RKAAEQNLAEAQCNLGACYENALGVRKDYTQAVKWYRKAAEQNNHKAQFSLGMIYYNGEGVARDYVETYKWWGLAAAKGVKDAVQIRLVTSAGLISAKVIKVDSANDLALLKAEGKFTALPVAASRSMKLGGTVVTVGFPNIILQGFAPKFARGEIGSLSGPE